MGEAVLSVMKLDVFGNALESIRTAPLEILIEGVEVDAESTTEVAAALPTVTPPLAHKLRP